MRASSGLGWLLVTEIARETRRAGMLEAGVHRVAHAPGLQFVHTYFADVQCNWLGSHRPGAAIAGAEARWRTLSTGVQLRALMYATTCSGYVVRWESEGRCLG